MRTLQPERMCSIPFVLHCIGIEPDFHVGSKGYDCFEWVTSLEKRLQKFNPIMCKVFNAYYINDVPSTILATELVTGENVLLLRFSRMRKELKRSASAYNGVAVAELRRSFIRWGLMTFEKKRIEKIALDHPYRC